MDIEQIRLTRETKAKIGLEGIPSCGCFAVQDEGMSETGLAMIGQALSYGEQIGIGMSVAGVCPTAIPKMLAILVHSALLIAATARAEDPENIYSVVDSMELVNDDVTRALRHLRGTPRQTLRREAN